MSENTIHPYEGLFLFSQSAGSNLGEAAEHVQGLLSKVDAEILSFGKWDERRLAYEIKGNKRGIYFLSYFTIPANQMADLDRACGLSEELLRFLITRADQIDAMEVESTEGREALKEEIATRALQAETGTTDVGVRATTRSDRETAETATEAASEEAPAQEAPAKEVAAEAPTEAVATEAVAAEAPTEAVAAEDDADEAVATTDT